MDSWSVTGSDFASGTAVIDETVTIGLRKGDRVWFAFSKNDVAATFDNGSSTTFLECTDITDYGIFYGDTWQMAPNLPEYQTDRFNQMGNKGVWVALQNWKRTTSN